MTSGRSIAERDRMSRLLEVSIVIVGVVLAMLLRLSLSPFQSGDYVGFTSGWYAAIQADGLRAIGQGVSNYTPPYMYMLAFVAWLAPWLEPVVAIKIPAMVCDLISAWLISQIVRRRYPSGPVPILALFAALLAPTVVINSALWGQADSIYTMFLVGCLLLLLRGRMALAVLAFGFAFAIKAQALFLAPLLIALMLRRLIPLRTVLLIPLAYLAAILPAWLLGRPLADLLLIYSAQSETYGQLSRNAPNMYMWLSDDFYALFLQAGLIWATALVCVYVALVLHSCRRISEPILIELALLSVVLLPFVLPKMHERYFYAADVIAIIYGFYFPKRAYIPIAISVISFFAYQPFLFQQTIIPLPLLALGMLGVIAVLARYTVVELLGD
jgi:Gpi18-like mannosyltransferase